MKIKVMKVKIMKMEANNKLKPLCRARKGFVFSLDTAVAVLLTVLMMSAAHRYMADSEKNSISNAQMAAVGSDIAALLDYKGILQTLDEEKIESGMNDLMPQNYDMMLKIVTDDNTVLYAGDSVPGAQFVATGKRFFVIKDGDLIDNYAYVSYSIWAR